MVDNEAIARAMFDALNNEDPDAYTDYFTDDAVYINAYRHRKNKDEIREEMRACFSTFTNFRNIIERITVDGDTAWVEFRYTFEVSGQSLVSIMSRFYGEETAREKYGASDTVKAFDLPHVYIFDFMDGKVKQWTCYYNTDLLTQ
jgi:uncharacterized protein (TIGR02246 family)